MIHISLQAVSVEMLLISVGVIAGLLLYIQKHSVDQAANMPPILNSLYGNAQQCNCLNIYVLQFYQLETSRHAALSTSVSLPVQYGGAPLHVPSS